MFLENSGLFKDEAFIKHLTREDPNLAQRILDWIKDTIRKVGADADTKFLINAQRIYERAARDVRAQKKTANNGGDAQYSIKRTREMTLAKQLKELYGGKMRSSDSLYFGETPASLETAGLDRLPLAFTIADFKKSTQEKHKVPRRVLKRLNEDLETALFTFSDGDRISVVTSDIDGNGKPLLVGIERNTVIDRQAVNAIRSVYGLDHPAEWLKNQIDSGKTFTLLNEERANAFLQTYGYSASVGDGIHSLEDSVPQKDGNVKAKFSISLPVEETKDLIALHNMTEKNLRDALELGGLPMPSIAVVKAEQGHAKFGPISLVLSKNTIDPKVSAKNKVYGGDAWTPTAQR